MDRTAAREALSGPIPSIRTPFLEDGTVDHASLSGLVEACLAAGARALMLTAGDSHYLCLSDEEIIQVTRTVCEQARRRALVIAADRYHSTTRAVEFARLVREIGADMVMCLPPDWGGSCTPDTLAEHYATVADHLPVVLVTGALAPRGHGFALDTIRKAIERSRRIVAIKDDICGDFAQRLCLLAYGEVALFAGGQKQSHLSMWPFGVDGYLSTFLSFKPDMAHRYWEAIEAGDAASARSLVGALDMPWFDHIMGYPGGFDAAIHGVMEIYGLAQRWRRKPYYSLNDSELAKLRAFHEELGLL